MGKKHKQPIIGISMCLDERLVRPGVRYSIIRSEYARSVRAAGGQPVFLENHIDPAVAVELCDGIIISGGEDIEPALYGQKQSVEHATEPSDRTVWERKLIDACDKKGVHILGVCYGSQLLNWHYGGTLLQDIASQQPDAIDHGSSEGSVMQRVKFASDFLSFQKGDYVETAHRHHQAVGDLAPGFSAVAIADDGVVEAIAGKGHFGIQWHSESDGTAPAIYGAFVALCAGEPTPELDYDPAPEAA
jgi:putative glutamine amidotransferase